MLATGATVQAAISPRILISTDKGDNWNSLQREFGFSKIMGSYFFNENEGVICGYNNAGNIFKTYDGGISWQVKCSENYFLDELFFLNNSLGWAIGQNLLLRTTDAGETWQNIPIGATEYLRSVFFINENVGWVVGNYNDNYRTTDGGNTWIPMYATTNLEPRKVFFVDELNGWIAGNYGYLNKTTDGGQTWTQVPDMPLIYFNDLYFENLNKGILAADGGKIYVTNDGGDTWQSVTTGTGFDIDALFYLNGNNVWAAGYNGVILKSTDDGLSWQPGESPNYRNLNSIFFLNDSLGWAFGDNGTVIKTLNGGVTPVEMLSFNFNISNGKVLLTWSTSTEINNRGFEIQSSDPNIGNNSQEWNVIGFVSGNGTTTYMHTYSFMDDREVPDLRKYRLKQIDFDGTYKYSNIIEVNIDSPLRFSLGQNFPNPFNPATKINYSIPQKSQVQIKVFDILGKEIETLVNEEKPSGTYELNWDAVNLPSGVYFYQMRAGDFIQTKKMIILK